MNRNTKAVLAIASVIIVISAAYVSLSYSQGNKEILSVYSADAYKPEVSKLVSGFHNFTGLNVAPVTAGGSFSDAYNIKYGSPASVFISVSLESYRKSYPGNYSSGWALAFAADQMVLAYSNATLGNPVAGSIINQFGQGVATNNTTVLEDAFTNLTSGKVKVGISNPLSDPAGIRGWLSLQMAGYLYHGGNASYFSGMLKKNYGNYSSSNAAELVTPLTLGQIQFLFIYKSSAITHGLSYVSLPSGVNQGNASLGNFYSRFSFDAGGKTVSGSPILLFVSILRNGTDPIGSEKFVSYLMNNTNVFSDSGLTLLTPMLLYGKAVGVPAISWGESAGMIKNRSPNLQVI